jgi:sulfur-oxidizing protein SoxZ
MARIKPRVRVPSKAEAGEVITIKTLISHPMESGQRKDKEGNVIPRQIINRFLATFNGETVIDVEMEPAVSSNPYIEFQSKVPESGEFHFQWFDDDGSVYELKEKIEVA